MNDRDAKLLISNLLERLIIQVGGAMDLPGGRLSKQEVNALRFILGNSGAVGEANVSDDGSVSSAVIDAPSEDRIFLNRAAFDRIGPKALDLRLCLDFGTAMSKAWATGADESETLPIVLGRDAAGEAALVVDSAVFIDDDGRVYLGEAAVRQFRPHAGHGRHLYNNIKRLLSDAEVESDLHSWRLDLAIDPTSSNLSRGDLLVLYLAWLTDRSLNALSEAIAASELQLPAGSDLRAVARRFAIPCFEDTHNDGRGRSRAAWARRIMRQGLLRAQVLADTLAGGWEELTVSKLAPLMEELRTLDVAPLESLLAEGADVREPVAAGASRFSSRLGLRTERGLTRQTLLVVDAGAGTTDFALFQVAAGAGRSPRYALVRNSVKMSTVAGNTADMVLTPLLLRACGIDPLSGAPRTPDDFAFIRNDLNSRIRELKHIVVSRGSIDIALSLNTSGKLLIEDFNQAMVRHANELREIRDTIINTTFTPTVRESFGYLGPQNEPYTVSVLLTGGSAALPAVSALSLGEINLAGFRVRFLPVDETPDWIRDLPEGVSRSVAAVYPQCAVAIGGSAVELPLEIDDLRALVVAPPPGPRVLPRSRMSGPLG